MAAPALSPCRSPAPGRVDGRSGSRRAASGSSKELHGLEVFDDITHQAALRALWLAGNGRAPSSAMALEAGGSQRQVCCWARAEGCFFPILCCVSAPSTKPGVWRLLEIRLLIMKGTSGDLRWEHVWNIWTNLNEGQREPCFPGASRSLPSKRKTDGSGLHTLSHAKSRAVPLASGSTEMQKHAPSPTHPPAEATPLGAAAIWCLQAGDTSACLAGPLHAGC